MKIIIYRCSVALPLEQTTQFTTREVSGMFYLVSNQLALTDEEQISFTLGLLKSFTQDDSVTFFFFFSLKRLLFWNFEIWKDTEFDPEISVAQHKSRALKRAIFECVHINESLESIEFTEITDTLPKSKKQHTDTGSLKFFGSVLEILFEPVYFSILLTIIMLIVSAYLTGKNTFSYAQIEKELQQGTRESAEERLKKFGDSLDKRRLQIAIREASVIPVLPAAIQPTPPLDEFYTYQVQPGDTPISILKNCYGKYSNEQWDKILKDNSQFNSLKMLKIGQKLRIQNPVNKECKL